LKDLALSGNPGYVEKRHNDSKAEINNKSGKTIDLPILTLKNNPPLENCVNFFERFFILCGLGRTPQEKTSEYGLDESGWYKMKTEVQSFSTYGINYIDCRCYGSLSIQCVIVSREGSH